MFRFDFHEDLERFDSSIMCWDVWVYTFFPSKLTQICASKISASPESLKKWSKICQEKLTEMPPFLLRGQPCTIYTTNTLHYNIISILAFTKLALVNKNQANKQKQNTHTHTNKQKQKNQNKNIISSALDPYWTKCWIMLNAT